MRQVLDRGKAIVPALRAFSQELPQGRRRRQLEAVIETIESGDVATATVAVGKLPDYWLPLLSAAGASNDPEPLLREFVEESQRSDELRREWWMALAYPVVILGLAIAIVVVLSLLVVPTFRSIFDDFEIELPPLTKAVLAIAKGVASGWLLVIAAVIVASIWLAVWLAKRLPGHWQSKWNDRFRLPSRRAASLARFHRYMASSLEAGLSAADALRVVGFATKSRYLSGAAYGLANDMNNQAVAVSESYRRPLTATFMYVMQSEVEPSARIRVLKELSACYADRARLKLSWKRWIIGPAAICVVGLMVGITVLALFLPLVKLVQMLT